MGLQIGLHAKLNDQKNLFSWFWRNSHFAFKTPWVDILTASWICLSSADLWDFITLNTNFGRIKRSGCDTAQCFQMWLESFLLTASSIMFLAPLIHTAASFTNIAAHIRSHLLTYLTNRRVNYRLLFAYRRALSSMIFTYWAVCSMAPAIG